MALGMMMRGAASRRPLSSPDSLLPPAMRMPATGLVPMAMNNGVDTTLAGMGMAPAAIAAGNPQTDPSMSLAMNPLNGGAANPLTPALAPDPTGIQQVAGSMPRVRPHFFDQGGMGSKILHGLGEFALNYSASQGNPAALMQLRARQAQLDAQREQQVWQQRHDLARSEQLADRDYEANRPQYFAGGQDRVRYDPTTGQSQTIYDAPMPAEAYARNFGDPGSDAYKSALSDYTLRNWGDTAMGNRLQMEDVRFDNRQALKQTPTYRDTHARPAPPRQPTISNVVAGLLQKRGKGVPLTPGEASVLDGWMTRSGRGGRGGGGSAGGGTGSSAGNPVIVRSPEEARRLAPGTYFQTTDGRIKVAG